MSYPDPASIKFHTDRLARILASHDKLNAAIASGDNETACRIGRSFYRNDKAKRHRMYESASWLRTYVSGQAGPLQSAEDCRVALNRSKLIMFAKAS